MGSVQPGSGHTVGPVQPMGCETHEIVEDCSIGPAHGILAASCLDETHGAEGVYGIDAAHGTVVCHGTDAAQAWPQALILDRCAHIYPVGVDLCSRVSCVRLMHGTHRCAGYLCMLPAVRRLGHCISAVVGEFMSIAVFYAGTIVFFAWIAVVMFDDVKGEVNGQPVNKAMRRRPADRPIDQPTTDDRAPNDRRPTVRPTHRLADQTTDDLRRPIADDQRPATDDEATTTGPKRMHPHGLATSGTSRVKMRRQILVLPLSELGPISPPALSDPMPASLQRVGMQHTHQG